MAKRMKLISVSEYERLTKSRSGIPISPDESVILNKSAKASKVLSLETIPDDVKLALYNSIVHSLYSDFT
jgi:hypothetical protein